jgi:hypothetical protein
VGSCRAVPSSCPHSSLVPRLCARTGLAKDDDSGIKKFPVADFTEWKNKKLRFKQENLERVFEARRDARLGKGATFQHPGIPASSLKSYGISRLYSSKTTVRVEDGGKKHKVIFKILELKVLSVKGSGSAVLESLITEKV